MPGWKKKRKEGKWEKSRIRDRREKKRQEYSEGG